MRIAIVNDMALAREALRRVVQSVPGYVVAWQAADGAEAVRRARADCPDVILMDLIMPVMNGAEATRQIMQSCPCPILVVTAHVRTNFPLVLEALSNGACDAVNTPELSPEGKVREGEALLTRLHRLEKSRHLKDEAQPVGPMRREGAASDSAILAPSSFKGTFLALGASTGGPEALARVLGALPAGFPAPVVVIQHMSAEFIPDLVAFLHGCCRLPVDFAREGKIPAVGTVSVAATDDHLILTRGGRFAITREPADYPFRPSVNVFFESLAAHWSGPGVAVLLTGMGNDGARGMALLRQSGWYTLAQDAGSSVVYGMPKAAAEIHAACRVLPLEQIPGAILTRFDLGRRSG